MNRRLSAALVASLALLALPAWRAAAETIHPVLTAPGALPGFQGTTRFDGTDTVDGVTRRLTVDVDFAVFAPGSFPASLGPFTPALGLPAFLPTDYVYAYQLFNVGSQVPGQDSLSLSLLSIDFDATSTFHAIGQGLAPDSGSVPITLALASDSAKYVYFFPGILAGQHSLVLLMSSTEAPGMIHSYVIGGATAPVAPLPSPTTAVPAPAAATAGLALLALLLLLPRATGSRLLRRAGADAAR